MMAKSILLLLLALLGAAATRIAQFADIIRDVPIGDQVDGNLEEDQHRLLGQDICEDGAIPTKLYYFEVTVSLEPDNSTDVCLLADQVLLGHDINILLFDYGIGAAGADDDAVFLAGVCPEPSSAGRRKLLRKRKGYIFTGGGGCRGCFGGDNRDKKMVRNLQQQVTGSSEKGWFTNIYAPWLEITLETAIASDIIPQHRSCMGQVPQHIGVEIIEVQLSELELRCDDGKVIDTFQSLSLTDEPLRDRECTKCASIDFSEYKDNDQTKLLVKGDYVKTNWKAEHGFTVSASGGYNPSFQARILDTGDQHCINDEHGTLEFGSPNLHCSNSGHAQGNGGRPGESGENCDPVGNELVVQESNKTCPDSNPHGGIIKFVFDTPVLVSDIGLMDVDEAEQRIKITYDDGVSELFAYLGFGDNAVQRVICNKLNVKMLEVIFPGTGAITEINFCPECRPLKKRSGADNHCLITESGGTIMEVEEIAFDDFEHSDNKEAVKGWKFTHLDTTEKEAFSQFLGGNGTENASPYRVYKVPRDADRVTFELDIYEIDSWDDNMFVKDQAAIYVDGEKIGLGVFGSNTDEGVSSGITRHGITWTRASFGQPAYLGFNENIKDQKHHVTIQVPEITGLMRNGKLRLTLQAMVLGNHSDESVGWDNVRVTVRHGCATSKNATLYVPTPPVSPNCDNESFQLVTYEDFEGSNPLAGWSYGRLEAFELEGFSTFLGRYGKGDATPYKTFNVPSTADVLMLELDFYEIDSWDGIFNHGTDSASVYLDDFKINLGIFEHERDEGSYSIHFLSGITLSRSSVGTTLANLGFRSENDQKHHVVIKIPRSTGLFTDGTIKVKLETDVTHDIRDESGGWDNIRILSKADCVGLSGVTTTTDASRHPTLAPTRYSTPTPSIVLAPDPIIPPTRRPTRVPTFPLTMWPSRSPQSSDVTFPAFPTDAFTEQPTPAPNSETVFGPSRSPTRHPTRVPTRPPSTETALGPSRSPTSSRSPTPSRPPTPSRSPTPRPTRVPTRPPSTETALGPSRSPTPYPTRVPTRPPSTETELGPSRSPTPYPTRVPTLPPAL